QKTPDAVAVVFENQKLTYLELNSRANQIACYLQQIGVKPEVIVGVCMNRSPEMLIALLAILKAGGAYVPLDTAYPQERLTFMLDDSKAKVVLTQTNLVKLFAQPNLHVVCVDRDLQLDSQLTGENLDIETQANHLAYVIYTSGSTGIPKGVAIEHQSAVALLSWSQEVFTEDDIAGVLASTSICFDLSIFEIFVPLSRGGTVILVENALHLPSLSAEVSLINTVPSVMHQLIQTNSLPASVKTINLAGEPLANQLVQQIYQHHHVQKVFNLYGPSEDTTYSTFTLIAPESERITIGRPISNTQIYLLDSQLQPVPIGVPGEIYLAGSGLARGYLNQPELNEKSFLQNPFENKPASRMYKTGDLARYLQDGNIEYLGRLDRQLKIRGFRIELGEIENALLRHPAVESAVAMARANEIDQQQLVAYLVSEKNQQPTISELRQYLQGILPNYMIPSSFFFLESIPLLPNGKIDRLALPVPENLRPTLATTYKAPQSETEQKIAKLWQEVLHLDRVGIDDNFFDLGGHSLLLLELNQKLNKSLQQELAIVQMFQYPTIASLAQFISQDSPEEDTFQSLRNRVQRQKQTRHKQLQKKSRNLAR
ncbi:MAG: amino acid adenylation domain-containing protein, partial [Cyanobacteria bacterium P01_C01_bin.72]